MCTCMSWVWCSDMPWLCSSCKAGIIGSFPALNARPKELLDEWLTKIKADLAEHSAAHPDRPAAPFAVNQIVHGSNKRLMADLEMCVKHEVPLVITSLGARQDVNDAIHSYGGIVLHDVTNVTHAKKAREREANPSPNPTPTPTPNPNPNPNAAPNPNPNPMPRRRARAGV
jgi:NAD(P)H-dependent flavin oxidoreductase YrpB (nitropropane dioxygenase family)